MATTTGPMHSLEASGTLANLLNFSSNKGRQYARKKPNPVSPDTAPQLSTRVMMRFLSQSWSTFDAATKLQWESAAEPMEISGFNLWIKINQERWGTLRYPSKIYPVAEANTPTASSLVAVQVSPGLISLSPFAGTGGTKFAYSLFQSASNGFTPSRNDYIGSVLRNAMDDQELRIDNVPSGTWYFRSVGNNTTGANGPASTQQTIVVV